MITVNSGNNTNTLQYTETTVYGKDNTFKTTVIYDGAVTVTEGYWAFVGGYDEVKKEECIVLRTKSKVTSSGTTLYTGDEMPNSIVRLKRLSNKEIIAESKGTRTSGNTVYNYTSTLTYSQK